MSSNLDPPNPAKVRAAGGHRGDDPYDLTESAWRRRFARRLAGEHALERARARAAALDAAAEPLTAPTLPARSAPSPALLDHLANVRGRGTTPAGAA